LTGDRPDGNLGLGESEEALAADLTMGKSSCISR
jgi:hypothetical protein